MNSPKYAKGQPVSYRGVNTTVTDVSVGYGGQLDYEVGLKGGGCEGGILESELSDAAPVEMIEVSVADLVGSALDWAVGAALGAEVKDHAFCDQPGSYMHPNCTVFPDGRAASHWKPSTNWSQGGPLIVEYGVLLSPKEALIHAHGGPNAGWRESGQWGATIFRKGKHRRKSHNHPDEPLVAAMRSVVNWIMGEWVTVPAKLVQAVQS